MRRYGRPKTRKVYVTKLRRRAKQTRSFLGIGNPMHYLAGAVGLVAAKKLIGQNSITKWSMGAYDPALQKIAVGAASQFLNLDNADMISVGVKELGATLLDEVTAGSKGLGVVSGGI